MESKIIFLGTAGDSAIAGKQTRASGGIIIQHDEIQLHINPGPGSTVRAIQYGVNLRANTALLVSDSSLLNCNDINAVIDAMTLGGFDKKGVLIANNTVVNGSEMTKACLTDKHKNYVEKAIVMKKGGKVGIEDLEVHAIPAFNEEMDGLGFKIIGPSVTITYSGNTKYRADLIELYKKSDILILDVTDTNDTKEKTGLTPQDAVNIIKKVNPKLAVITHFGSRLSKSDPLYEARLIQRETSVQTIAAKDGMIINTSSFSAKMKQENLKSFEKSSKPKITEEVTEIEDIEPAETKSASEIQEAPKEQAQQVNEDVISKEEEEGDDETEVQKKLLNEEEKHEEE